MPAFTVLEPSRRHWGDSERIDGLIFLRERFSRGAFLFGPLWMIWRRLWIVLIIYLAVVGFAGYGLRAAGIGWLALGCIFGLIQLLVGLEATNLLRWARLRDGWHDRGVVIADDLDMAERRFFDSRAVRRSAASPVVVSAPAQPPAAPVAPPRPDIIGLFPEPGGGR